MQWTCKVPARVVRALYFPDFSRPAQFLVTCPRGSFVPISDWSDPATDHLKLETSASWTNFLFHKAPLAQHWALICFYYIYGLWQLSRKPFSQTPHPHLKKYLLSLLESKSNMFLFLRFSLYGHLPDTLHVDCPYCEVTWIDDVPTFYQMVAHIFRLTPMRGETVWGD